MEFEAHNSKYSVEHRHINVDEKIASLFEPDVLSSHDFDNLHRRTLLEPEKKLMLAVLEDAINCFQDNLLAQSGRGKKVFEEAEEWILQEDADWLFSFETTCEVLGINPQYVRQGLLRWKEKKLANHRIILHLTFEKRPRWLAKGGHEIDFTKSFRERH